MIQDVVIVGGGVAGLTAALCLGRFRHHVIVFDTERQANRFSHAAHNFFTRDGASPAELIAIGRDQLRPYETVQFQLGEVTQIVREGDQFKVMTADGTSYQAKNILLATGLKDALPPIEGLDRFWGRSVFHCPYCDGWELRDKPVAVLGNGDGALHYAKLLHALTDDLVICTNGAATFSEADRALLIANRIGVIETLISRVEGHDHQLEQIIFDDGQTLSRSAIFTRPTSTQQNDLAREIGCAMTADGLVQTDELGQTTVPGVFAAGDLTTLHRQLVKASMQGANAGARINMLLVEAAFK